VGKAGLTLCYVEDKICCDRCVAGVEGFVSVDVVVIDSATKEPTEN
jgi:hypothetical protein